MNSWNQLESQLLSWRPRQPSPRLKTKLFSQGQTVTGMEYPAVSIPLGGRWQWLAPVFGCVLVAAVLLMPRNSQFPYLDGYPTNSLLATAMSNQSYTAYIAAGTHSGQNQIPMDLLSWPRSKPTPGLLPVSQTNK